MPRRPPRKKIEAWSFSRWNLYNRCPRKAKYQIIEKRPTKPNAAMLRGREVHDDADKFVSGKILTLPQSLELFDDEFHQLADLKKKKRSPVNISTELQLSFTRDWVSCDWFARNAWGRVVIDLLAENKKERRATAIDYKTGKISDDYELQLELEAATIFALKPHIEVVKTELWYLDQGEIIGGDEETGEGIYTIDQADDLINTWVVFQKHPVYQET